MALHMITGVLSPFGFRSLQYRTPLEALSMAASKAEVASTEELNLFENYDLLHSFYKIPAIDKAWLFPSRTGTASFLSFYELPS